MHTHFRGRDRDRVAASRWGASRSASIGDQTRAVGAGFRHADEQTLAATGKTADGREFHRAAEADAVRRSWAAQRRPPLLLGTGAAMPVPRQPLQRSPNVRNDAARSRSSGIGSARPCQHTGWRPRQQKQRVSANLSKREKHRKSLQRPVAAVAARSVCWLLPPPLLVPLSGATGSSDLASTQKQHRRPTPATKAETSSKNKKTERVYGDPLPPLPRSCVLAAGPVTQVDPTALAASEENSEKWRLRLPCSAQGLSVRAGQRIQCSIGRQSIERARPPRC